MQLATWITVAISIVLIVALELFGKKQERHLAVLGISFVIGLAILGTFIVQSRQTEKTLHVVGYATKPFVSDLVKWNVTITRNCSPDMIGETTAAVYRDTQTFKQHLLDKKIPEKDIDIQPVYSMQVTDRDGNIVSYTMSQNVYVISTDMTTIEDMSINPAFFAEKGIVISNSNLGYYYTKLPELKKALLSEATKDAVARAKEITSASRNKAGKIINARAGVFQITEPYSTEVSDYGQYNTATKNKHISVTLTADFSLK
ncbi:MAG TPA: SIMPL domain-containing protein [Candidatus Cloacimonadota bacterium]|nr:SIMPL domain-containing protein [Candidatus Cloacimonadota bacterium]HPS39160.1 SIMPL domain-containing protein [Candidatus Cloacimonadota bacterium]